MADVVAGSAFGVQVLVVETRPQIGVTQGRVGEQVPDDDQDGAFGGDERLDFPRRLTSRR
jgi:hypothetical protein